MKVELQNYLLDFESKKCLPKFEPVPILLRFLLALA